MHEIGIVRQLVRTVTDFVSENRIGEIREVVADCGELSLVIPEYVEELYPIAAKGSILENAKLTVNVVPGLAECDDCDEIFNVVEHKGICPACGSFEKTVLSGKDFTIREIVVSDGQED
ncbi:MAG: hydrogenase maturation nickel metallochaperone HypA [Oscillospiraceae bacterium]|nr:hydrogenase maturation nickel metallochaperone HypA [Oscillospiraceae bacterium]